MAPYEPLSDTLLADVTRMTVFFAGAGLGRERWRVAALLSGNHHLWFARDFSSVALLPATLFRSKTQRHHVASSSKEVPALTPFVGRRKPDHLLCPLRALRWYLDRTSDTPLRGPRLQLFFPFTGRTVNLSPAMTSSWICRTIWRDHLLDRDNVDSATARVSTHVV